MANLHSAESSAERSAIREALQDWEVPFIEPQESAKSASIRSSIRSRNSSMAPAQIHQSTTGAALPSLKSMQTEATPTESSISTGLAIHFDGVPLLEEDNQVLVLPPVLPERRPTYECPFWFLSCGYISHEREEWQTHSFAHFRGEEPPRASVCPLCERAFMFEDGWSAWTYRLQHIAEAHSKLGQTLRTSRPDFSLFHHLWKKRLIDDEDLKELMGGEHNLRHPPGNFTTSHRRDNRRRNLQSQTSLRSHDQLAYIALGLPLQSEATDMSLETIDDAAIPNFPEPDQNPVTSVNDDRGDSGYGSLSYTGQMSSRLEEDTATIRTMLSDASLVFQPPHERESLISAFVRDFDGDAKLHELSENAKSRAIARLSELLKMYSMRLDDGALSQEERDAKDFIRQQRGRISEQVRKLYSTDDVPNANTFRDFPKESMSIEDKIALGNFAPSEEPEIDEVTIPPRYQEVRSFLLQSSAYKLLVKRAGSAAFLSVPKHDAQNQIAQTMNNLLAKLRKSDTRARTTYEIYFTLEWNLPEFLQDQAYDCTLTKAIESAIVIIGDSADAQAMECEQYMEQLWPGTGREVLKNLSRAVSIESQPGHSSKGLRPSHKFQLADGTKLEFKFGQSQTSISAEGNQASLTELAEQFAWLGSALRPSLTTNGITTFTPYIEDFFISDDQASAYVHVDFVGHVPSDREDTVISSCPTCWQKMFRNPSVVQGFPIKARDNGECGLQIDFPLLVTLANVQYLTSYCSTVILKGLVSMLVPTEKSNQSITWHFLCNEMGKRMQYSMFRRCESWLSVDQIQPDQIASSNIAHFVGWCPKIERNFGADQDTYDSIGYAGAKKCTAGLAVEQKLTISASKYIGLSGAIVRGNRDRAEFLKYTGYSAQIEAASKIPVLLYDTATQRGWLADGASALLHITRTQVVQKPYGGDNSLFNNLKYNVCNFKHPSPEMGPGAAKRALFEESNMKHKILREFDGYAEEKIDWDQDDFESHLSNSSTSQDSRSKHGSQEIYKTTCFKDLVCQTWSTLEQIYDRQMDQVMNHTTKPIQSPFETPLEGYEFMGIVSAKHILTRRNIGLQANGARWLPFVNGIHAVTLFGKHFGQLYKPTEDPMLGLCSPWTSVPCGQEYLVTPVSLLKDIQQNSIEEGDVDEFSHELVSGISWIPSKSMYKQCGPKCSHIILDRVQQISLKGKQVVKSALFNESLSCKGAVIFGENSILNTTRMQQASPRKPRPELAFEDSGLGSSIGASNMTSTSTANSEISQVDTQGTLPSTQSDSLARHSLGTSSENDVQVSGAEALPSISNGSELLSSTSVSPPPTTPSNIVSEQAAHLKVPKNERRSKAILQKMRDRLRRRA